MRHKNTFSRLRHQGVTPEACQLVEKERERIYSKTGVLKPRYEIISEAIFKAFGGSAEAV